MIREKNSLRAWEKLDKKVKSKNFVTLIALLSLVVLFYGLAIIRLKTS